MKIPDLQLNDSLLQPISNAGYKKISMTLRILKGNIDLYNNAIDQHVSDKHLKVICKEIEEIMVAAEKASGEFPVDNEAAHEIIAGVLARMTYLKSVISGSIDPVKFPFFPDSKNSQ